MRAWLLAGLLTALAVRPAAAAGVQVSLQPAFKVFPGSLYDNSITHRYAAASGSVSSPGSSGQPCEIAIRGLTPGHVYSVYFSASPVVPGDVESAGPFVLLGEFMAAVDGAGAYVCAQAPPPGGAAFINDKQLGITVLVAAGAPPCRLILGFATLHQLDPGDIGNCLDDQAFAANGDAQQHTTKGLLVWRKADNWSAFTNGYRTWINGPQGLVSRLNSERFAWEGAVTPHSG